MRSQIQYLDAIGYGRNQRVTIGGVQNIRASALAVAAVGVSSGGIPIVGTTEALKLVIELHCQ